MTYLIGVSILYITVLGTCNYYIELKGGTGMLIDLHVHESTFSRDSKMSLKEIVEDAKLKGLDGVCITDHDSLEIKEFAEAYAKKVNFPIFTGVEVYTTKGDIIAFGIDQLPDHRPDAQEFINYVKSHGGACFSAHPFRDNHRGLENNIFKVQGLDGIEVLNGNTSFEDNNRAWEACQKLNLQPLGASDAHSTAKLGRYATFLPYKVNTTKDLINALLSGNCSPAILENNEYHIVQR